MVCTILLYYVVCCCGFCVCLLLKVFCWGVRSFFMSLFCDRCFGRLDFMSLFKFDVGSDFDFCGRCFLELGKGFRERDGFEGQDERRCDLLEFVRLSFLVNEVFVADVGDLSLPINGSSGASALNGGI